MRPWAKNCVTRICWMLALLVPVQPAVALDCPCTCSTSHTSAPDCGELEDEHRHHAGTSCRHSHQHAKPTRPVQKDKNEVLTLASVLGFDPCQCPRDCDCQWKHSSGDRDVRNLNRLEEIDDLETPFTNWLPVLSDRERPSSSEYPTMDMGSRDLSALSRCAMLCRFLA